MTPAQVVEKYKGNPVCCVYLLLDDLNIVYVGSSKNPSSRIYSHVRSDKIFNSVKIIPCAINDRYTVEAENINKYNPKHNKNMPRPEIKIKLAAVALNPNIDKLLKEIVQSRIDNNSLIDNKIKVVADLIMKAHKKECK